MRIALMDYAVAEAFVDQWVTGWNAHDVDALLACMTADGIYYSSAGPGPFGAKASGTDALRQAYSAIWQAYPDAKW